MNQAEQQPLPAQRPLWQRLIPAILRFQVPERKGADGVRTKKVKCEMATAIGPQINSLLEAHQVLSCEDEGAP
jgi:hypothetical protein